MRAALHCFLLTLTAVVSYAQCEDVFSPVTHLGERHDLGVSIPQSNADQIVPHPGARYLRLRLKVDAMGDCAWYVVVRDSKYRPVEIIPKARFARSGETWTTRVNDSSVYLDYQRCAGSSPKLTIVEYITMPERASNPYYSLKNFQSGPDYRELYRDGEVNTTKRLGDHVGIFMSKWGDTAWSCSGVLLSPTIFLTNWHCGGLPGVLRDELYWNDDVLRDAIIDLSWDLDPVASEFRVVSVLDRDDERDFAILEIEPLGTGGGGRPAPIRTRALTATDTLTIIHHPAALPKQVSDCVPVNLERASWRGRAAATDFTHRCDTESGSSGAPIFDRSGALVGLHHEGFGFDETNCRPLDSVNKAVHILNILQFLEDRPSRILPKLGIVLP